MIRERAVTNRSFLLKKNYFSFLRAQHVLSYHLIKVPWLCYCFMLFSRVCQLPRQLNSFIVAESKRSSIWNLFITKSTSICFSLWLQSQFIMNVFIMSYCMSKKSCPFLYSEYTMKTGNYFVDSLVSTTNIQQKTKIS